MRWYLYIYKCALKGYDIFCIIGTFCTTFGKSSWWRADTQIIFLGD